MTTPTSRASTKPANAALLRRSAAIVYDAFLIIALWMVTTTLLVALASGGQEISGVAFQLFLYFQVFGFYYGFWRFKGQTLGMQVWKIKAVGPDGRILNSKQCIVRFLSATITLVPLGLGFIWMLFNKNNLALHDILSNTRVVYLGTKPYDSERT